MKFTLTMLFALCLSSVGVAEDVTFDFNLEASQVCSTPPTSVECDGRAVTSGGCEIHCPAPQVGVCRTTFKEDTCQLIDECFCAPAGADASDSVGDL